MLKLKTVFIWGLILGIALFFVGMIISNVFPSSETDLLSYKVSASIKLVGLGLLVGSMIVGGVFVEDLDKNLKMLLLLLGLVLLIIYSVASPSLEWKFSPSLGGTEYGSRPTGYGVPGFELVGALCAVGVVVLFFLRRRR
ncbi:MAG: hypothetical protein V1726_07460 [Methanobacteriota archaeon]